MAPSTKKILMASSKQRVYRTGSMSSHTMKQLTSTLEYWNTPQPIQTSSSIQFLTYERDGSRQWLEETGGLLRTHLSESKCTDIREPRAEHQ